MRELSRFTKGYGPDLYDSRLAYSWWRDEYCHPDTGITLSHKDFMDWDLLVLEMT